MVVGGPTPGLSVVGALLTTVQRARGVVCAKPKKQRTTGFVVLLNTSVEYESHEFNLSVDG